MTQLLAMNVRSWDTECRKLKKKLLKKKKVFMVTQDKSNTSENEATNYVLIALNDEISDSNELITLR